MMYFVKQYFVVLILSNAVCQSTDMMRKTDLSYKSSKKEGPDFWWISFSKKGLGGDQDVIIGYIAVSQGLDQRS